jgi:hypothetical protein
VSFLFVEKMDEVLRIALLPVPHTGLADKADAEPELDFGDAANNGSLGKSGGRVTVGD